MKTLAVSIISLAMGTSAVVKDPKMLKEEIVINASLDAVWSVLYENDKWAEWNPFIVKSEGEFVEGSKVKNHMKLNGKDYTFKPKMLSVKDQREIVWVGRFFLPGILDGKHYFTIEKLDDSRVKLTQKEHFTGILSSSFMKKNGNMTAENFRKMNLSLKKRAEEIYLAGK